MRSIPICALMLVLVLGACTQSASDGGTTSETGTETETGQQPDGWRAVFQAGEEIGALMSVWGSSVEDVYVVGGQPEPGGGRVLHLTGDGEWLAESLPPELPMLNWVFGVGASVWSVGLGGTIIHREAGVWSQESSPTDRVLWGVWGASADELWAVGGDAVSDDPVLLRRDGASGAWALVELPELGANSHGLFKVWGSAADDVWIVGDVGATLHYDGDTWTAHPDPAAIDLISVWGSPTEGVIAVGGRASGRIARVEAETWSSQTVALPGLNGVWVDPQAGATAVGQGTIIRIGVGGFDVEHEDAGTNLVLHSVFGFAGGPRFAVGGSLLMPPPFIGVIVRADEG